MDRPSSDSLRKREKAKRINLERVVKEGGPLVPLSVTFCPSQLSLPAMPLLLLSCILRSSKALFHSSWLQFLLQLKH